MTPEKEIQRANEAEHILGSEVFNDAFNQLDNELRTAWESSPARDTEGRELLWVQIKQLKVVRSNLETMVEGRKAAQATLADRARHIAGRIVSRF